MATCNCVVTAAEALFDAPPAGCATVGAVPAAADENHADPSLCGGRCTCPDGTYALDRGRGRGTECVHPMHHPALVQALGGPLTGYLNPKDLVSFTTAIPGIVGARIISPPNGSLAEIVKVIAALPDGGDPYGRGVIIDGDLAIETEADIAALKFPGLHAAIRVVTGNVRIDVNDEQRRHDQFLADHPEIKEYAIDELTNPDLFEYLLEEMDKRPQSNLVCEYREYVQNNWVDILSMSLEGAFGALREAGDVAIKRCEGLKSLEGAFGSLQKAAKIEIRENISLASMAGAFPALYEVGDILVSTNMALTTMRGAFGALRKVVRDLAFTDNVRIVSLNGAFPALHEVLTLKIRGHSSLTYMDGAFSTLYKAANIRIAGNRIRSLSDAFPAVISVDNRINIQHNRALTSMDNAFPALLNVGDIHVHYNHVLTSMFQAFRALHRADRIKIRRNPVLASMEGAFAALESVGSTDVSENGVDLVLPAALAT